MLNICIYLFVSWHFTSKNHTTFFLLVSISLTRNIQLDFVCLLFCAPLSRNTHDAFVCLFVSVLFDLPGIPVFILLLLFIFLLITTSTSCTYLFLSWLRFTFYLFLYLNICSLLSVVTLVPNCQGE